MFNDFYRHNEAVGDQDSPSTLTGFFFPPVADFSLRDSWRNCCWSTSPQWLLQVNHFFFIFNHFVVFVCEKSLKVCAVVAEMTSHNNAVVVDDTLLLLS